MLASVRGLSGAGARPMTPKLVHAAAVSVPGSCGTTTISIYVLASGGRVPSPHPTPPIACTIKVHCPWLGVDEATS